MTALATRIADMTEVERRFSRALHEGWCDEEPPGHPIEEHEPFEEDVEPWNDFVARLAKYGLRFELMPTYPTELIARLGTPEPNASYPYEVAHGAHASTPKGYHAYGCRASGCV